MMKAVLILIVIAGCAYGPQTSETEQPVENAVCGLPFPRQCYPLANGVECTAACAPQPGYCPEYPPSQVAACQDWCRGIGSPTFACDPFWCTPTYPRLCLYGAMALTGDVDE